jgi:hypothetical protein
MTQQESVGAWIGRVMGRRLATALQALVVLVLIPSALLAVTVGIWWPEVAAGRSIWAWMVTWCTALYVYHLVAGRLVTSIQAYVDRLRRPAKPTSEEISQAIREGVRRHHEAQR